MNSGEIVMRRPRLQYTGDQFNFIVNSSIFFIRDGPMECIVSLTL